MHYAVDAETGQKIVYGKKPKYQHKPTATVRRIQTGFDNSYDPMDLEEDPGDDMYWSGKDYYGEHKLPIFLDFSNSTANSEMTALR